MIRGILGNFGKFAHSFAKWTHPSGELVKGKRDITRKLADLLRKEKLQPSLENQVRFEEKLEERHARASLSQMQTTLDYDEPYAALIDTARLISDSAISSSTVDEIDSRWCRVTYKYEQLIFSWSA